MFIAKIETPQFFPNFKAVFLHEYYSVVKMVQVPFCLVVFYIINTCGLFNAKLNI